MRKYIILGLVVIAAAVYTWDVFLFVKPQNDRYADNVNAEISIDKLLAETQPVKFVDKGRDPFFLHRIEEKPASNQSSLANASVKAPAEAPKPPDIKVSGLIWNQNAPLAMITLPDGSSGVAKVGDSFDDIVIKKIEKNRMLITCKKRDYWITW